MRSSLLSRIEAIEAQVRAPQMVVPDAMEVLRLAGVIPDLWQTEVLAHQASRRLLLCSRQSGKTLVAAALALGTAMQEPGALILILRPSLRQSGESFRTVLELRR